MAVVSLKIDKKPNLNKIRTEIEQAKPKKGDLIQIESEESPTLLVVMVVLLAIYITIKKQPKEGSFTNEILDSLFNPNLNSQELENQIKQEYGIYIKMQPKKLTPLQEILLNAPSMTDKEYQEYLEKKEHFNQWK
jgi:hypothetical protein